MYKTTRNITGDTFMTCKDCGHAISMNKICERPIQAATDMLKHMAAHNASRAFAVAAGVMGPEPEQAIPAGELLPTLSALPQQLITSGSQLTN
jgi:hypothetical protein